MAKIHCYSTRCNKNKHGYCSASYINVVGENAHSTNETICSSYEDGNMFMNAISNINIFSGSSNNNIEVYCGVNNCFYNKSGSCRAENLKLKTNDINGSTACATFVEAY